MRPLQRSEWERTKQGGTRIGRSSWQRFDRFHEMITSMYSWRDVAARTLLVYQELFGCFLRGDTPVGTPCTGIWMWKVGWRGILLRGGSGLVSWCSGWIGGEGGVGMKTGGILIKVIYCVIGVESERMLEANE